MEIKLSVSIGATLQVKNARGEWDWIKPEVGAEVKFLEGDSKLETDLQEAFTNMWDNVVGPQFASVVSELLAEQGGGENEADDAEGTPPENPSLETTPTTDPHERPNTEEDDYY